MIKLADTRLITGILWSARILGLILLLLFVIFTFGRGMPNPANLQVNEAFMFLGMFTILTGFLVALKWEGFGGILMIDGFILFMVVEFLSSGSLAVGLIFYLFPLNGLMFLFYWWQNYREKLKK